MPMPVKVNGHWCCTGSWPAGATVDAVAGYEQVLVTAAVEEDLPPGLVGTTVRILAGEIVGAVAGDADTGPEHAGG